MLHSRRNKDREGGQIIVLFELVLIVILGFVALVVDLGLLRNNRQILVNTMDAAALAGGSKLPVTGSAEAAVANALINATIQKNYPGLPSSSYSITYKCLIGADATGPLVARDTPGVCDPHNKLGHTPVAGDFKGAGPTRVSACDPGLGDRCNTVVVSGSSITQYAFGPVLGVNHGSSGAVTAASCRGPCGNPPVIPVDLVIILDRTMSMAGSSGGADKITSLKNAAKAVLQVYDPAKQRVALVLTGPGKINASTGAPVSSSCGSGSAYGVADNNNWTPYTTTTASITNQTTAKTLKVNTPTGRPFPAVPFVINVDTERMTVTAVSGTTWTVTRNTPTTGTGGGIAAHNSGASVYGILPWVPGSGTYGMWVPVGLSGTDTVTDRALPSPNGAAGVYSSGGSVNTSSELVKAINCISAASDGTDLATPIKMAQWYLDNFGRKDVTQGIILETDGHPQYGFDSGGNQFGTNSAHTCQAAAAAAAAAKADTTNSEDGIQFFSIGYGVDSTVKCPTRTTSWTADNGNYNMAESTAWSNIPATTLLRAMATDAGHYFENPSSSTLASVFTQAATMLAHGGAHLIQLCPMPIVTGVGPATWTVGQTVTISGKNLSGAISASIGGSPAVILSGSDSSLTVRASFAGGGGGSVVTACS